NKVKEYGGGLYNGSQNAVTLAFDTITGNSGQFAGGIGNPPHNRIRSSIVAGNNGPNCDVAVQDEGGNVGDASCGFNQPSDAIANNPLLGALVGTPVPV